jgi:hypothetical protein
VDTDTAVSTAWQSSEREDAVVAQPVDILPGDPKHRRCLRRGHLFLGSQHHDTIAFGDIGKHRLDDPANLGIVLEVCG